MFPVLSALELYIVFGPRDRQAAVRSARAKAGQKLLGDSPCWFAELMLVMRFHIGVSVQQGKIMFTRAGANSIASARPRPSIAPFKAAATAPPAPQAGGSVQGT